ncbi:MAG: flavoprotein, partial [Alphaproteobacteria bacterium]
MKTKKRILLIVGGGISAYKTIELIRRLADENVETRVVLTAAAAKFITPLTFAAIS